MTQKKSPLPIILTIGIIIFIIAALALAAFFFLRGRGVGPGQLIPSASDSPGETGDGPALDDGEGEDIKAGDEIRVDIFEAGQHVDVSGVTQGKGFQGGIKRHHFSHQDYTHGNSVSHRAPGSTGQNQTPGRVFKGKKMAGHMGARNNTIQNLEVVRVDSERNLILIKGSVPGSRAGDIIIKPSLKKTAKA